MQSCSSLSLWCIISWRCQRRVASRLPWLLMLLFDTAAAGGVFFLHSNLPVEPDHGGYISG